MRYFVILLGIVALIIVSGCSRSVSETSLPPPTTTPQPPTTPPTSSDTPKATPAPTPAITPKPFVKPSPTATPSETQALIDRAVKTLQALKAKDIVGFAALVHPELGVRFSPYALINMDKDLVFKPDAVKTLLQSDKSYSWGYYDGSYIPGEPIQLTFAGYYAKFVYDQDFLSAPTVSVNTIIGKGNLQNNIAQAYPDGKFVEFHFPGFDKKLEGQDWESLRFIFVQKENVWYVAGIQHDRKFMFEATE